MITNKKTWLSRTYCRHASRCCLLCLRARRFVELRRIIRVCSCLLVLLSIPAVAQQVDEVREITPDRWRRAAEVSALVELESALGTRYGRFQKSELLISPELELKLGPDSVLTVTGRFRTDIEDRLEPGARTQYKRSDFNRRETFGDRTDFELRELVLETTLGDTYLTLGKQQLVWGQADGLKVLDVVNPQDFREFILDGFDDSRIPLWAVNVEIPIRDVVLQLIWIPDPTYHEIPWLEGTYAFISPALIPEAPPGVTVNIESPDSPDDMVADSDIGLRLSTFWKGWDLTLNYFYHYHDEPVLYQQLSLVAPVPTVTIKPRYRRSHLIGGTFSNAFGDLTLRGEVGLALERHLSTTNVSDADGVVKTDELAGVLGLDWFGYSETLISLQIFQNWVTRHGDDVIRKEFDINVTLLIQRDFLNKRWQTEFFWLHNANDGDGLIRPKLSHDFQTSLKVWIGADIFYGDRDGLFGQYQRNDRIVVGCEWGM